MLRDVGEKLCGDWGMRTCVLRLCLVDGASQHHVERVDEKNKARATCVGAQRGGAEEGEQPGANFVHYLRACEILKTFKCHIQIKRLLKN
eukprot:6213429-Pleurochrysis_carterae.AAC.3